MICWKCTHRLIADGGDGKCPLPFPEGRYDLSVESGMSYCKGYDFDAKARKPKKERRKKTKKGRMEAWAEEQVKKGRAKWK